MWPRERSTVTVAGRRSASASSTWPNGIRLPVGGSDAATITASSSIDSTVERGCLGPIGASATVWRLRHFWTVVELVPACRFARNAFSALVDDKPHLRHRQLGAGLGGEGQDG